MSNVVKVLLSVVLLGVATVSGYSLYNKNFVKNDPVVVAPVAPAPVPAPTPAPIVVAPVEAPKPEMPLEEVLPRIFKEEQKTRTEAPAPKPKQKEATVAKRVAGQTKKVVGVAIDGVADGVDAVIGAVKKTGNAIANAKCASSESRYNDPQCGWAREILAEQGITRYSDEYRRKYGPEK